MSLRSKLCSLAALFRTAIRFAESRTPAARSQFKGDHGEAICNWKLEFLPEGYFRFSNVLFPVPSNATVEIDHLVVSPHGIFVIESKAWSGLILGKPEDYFWTVCLVSSAAQIPEA